MNHPVWTVAGKKNAMHNGRSVNILKICNSECYIESGTTGTTNKSQLISKASLGKQALTDMQAGDMNDLLLSR